MAVSMVCLFIHFLNRIVISCQVNDYFRFVAYVFNKYECHILLPS
jgi:hypothetical protein